MINVLLQINWRFLERKIAGEPLSNILFCIGIILIALILRKPLAMLLTKMSGYITNRVKNKKNALQFQALVQKPLGLLLITILFYLAINQLSVLTDVVIFQRIQEGKTTLQIRIIDVADKAFLFFFIMLVTLALSRVVDFIFHTIIEKAQEEDNREREQLFPLIKDVTKIILWVIGIFWLLGSVVNVNIPALITGLGIGGVAIALAAKESIENFFASFTILTDKPFQAGDTVRLDKYEGKVERVGFRSTRLRNADGALYIIPNKKLIGDNLENLSQRYIRRVLVMINIKYGVPYEDLLRMINEIKAMMRSHDYLMEPVEVLLENFKEDVFQINVVYHLNNPLKEDQNLSDIKHEMNMKIYEIINDNLPSEFIKNKVIEEEENEKKQEESDSI